MQCLAGPVGNPPLAEIIRGQFNGDLVTTQNPDVMLAHLARNMGRHDMTVFQFDPEHGVGKGLGDGSFHFNVFFFCHKLVLNLVSGLDWRALYLIYPVLISPPA